MFSRVFCNYIQMYNLFAKLYSYVLLLIWKQYFDDKKIVNSPFKGDPVNSIRSLYHWNARKNAFFFRISRYSMLPLFFQTSLVTIFGGFETNSTFSRKWKKKGWTENKPFNLILQVLYKNKFIHIHLNSHYQYQGMTYYVKFIIL